MDRTVGYGSYAPATQEGQLFFLIYSLVGIALVGAALDQVSRDVLLAATAASKQVTHKAYISGRSELYMGIGLLVFFLLIGAVVFPAMQPHDLPWDNFESLYFSLVTLSTVGLGDVSEQPHCFCLVHGSLTHYMLHPCGQYVPASEPSLIVLGVYMVLALGVCAFVLSSAADNAGQLLSAGSISTAFRRAKRRCFRAPGTSVAPSTVVVSGDDPALPKEAEGAVEMLRMPQPPTRPPSSTAASSSAADARRRLRAAANVVSATQGVSLAVKRARTRAAAREATRAALAKQRAAQRLFTLGAMDAPPPGPRRLPALTPQRRRVTRKSTASEGASGSDA